MLDSTFLQEWCFGRSRSSKVIYFGANRKRICDFLLVRNRNFGHTLHRFGATAFLMCSWPHPLFNPNFGDVPVAQDRPCWASTSAWALSYLAVKLFSKNSNLFEFWTRYLNVTDGRTTCNLITALCVALRGKNCNVLKRRKIGDRTQLFYYDGLIGSRISAFDWRQNKWPWMTLNGRNITLAEMWSPA